MYGNLIWVQRRSGSITATTTRSMRKNRRRFHGEEEFPSPKTLRHAANWVEQHHGDDNWFLLIDSFDPHEPFDYPDEAAVYPDDYHDKLFYWPQYAGSGQAPAAAMGAYPQAICHPRHHERPLAG